MIINKTSRIFIHTTKIFNESDPKYIITINSARVFFKNSRFKTKETAVKLINKYYNPRPIYDNNFTFRYITFQKDVF